MVLVVMVVRGDGDGGYCGDGAGGDGGYCGDGAGGDGGTW